MLEILFFIFAAIAGYYLNVILIEYDYRTRLSANPKAQTQERWASGRKPLVGGVSFYILFLVSLAAYHFLPRVNEPDYLNEGLPLLLSGSLGFIVGLADDAYTTRPFLKFLGQTICGLIFIACGVYIHFFDFAPADYFLTLFWVVGVMNSINMLDNMDGVTGGVSFGILLTFIILLRLTDRADGLLYFSTVVLLGALAGFLVLNRPPARLYMGDTGSQFLGVYLAYVGVVYFWNHDPFFYQTDKLQSRQLLLPLLFFLMTIMDTTFVTFARLGRGRSPFVGGKDHTTHHLVYFGLPERVVPLVTFSVTAVGGVMALFAVSVKRGWTHVHTALFATFILAMYGVFLYLYRTGAANFKQKNQSTSIPAPPKSLPVESEPVSRT